MRLSFPAFLMLITMIGKAQFPNITISKTAPDKYPPLEPSVTINPQDPDNIVAGVALDRILTTRDGGKIWLEIPVKSPYGVYGDAVMTADPKGNLYFFHLADPSGKGRSADEWLDRIVCHRSSDKGILWNTGTFTGLNPPKDNDKPWATSHMKKEFLALTWTQFDKYGSQDEGCKTNILFSKSTSKGEKWEDPIAINLKPGDCKDDDLTAMGATPFIDLTGRVFVAWSNGGVIYLDRSFDGGTTWLRRDIEVTRQMGGWNMDIPGLGRANGLPVLNGDNSPSPYNGALYVVFADQRFGENDTDIWFVKSPNRGDNWSEPVRIGSAAAAKHQFMPWMTVDQSNGYIYIVYYERKDYEDNRTDVHLSWSSDGGNHFTDHKISESPFVPDSKVFFGDYTNIAAHNGLIVPVWTRMDEGKTSVLTTIIRQDQLKKP